MSRIGLAFSCFFKLLFGASLPAGAAKFLPEGAATDQLPPPGPKDSEKAPVKKDSKPKKSVAHHHRDGSLAMLALLQREGRLIDFLQEDIEDYEDADIGAAVRDIHRGCRKILREQLVLEAVMPGEEDDNVTIAEGFDVSEIKLVGEVKGEPPFKGVLRHHGWRVSEVNLPKLTGDIDRRILSPAQVEVK